MVLPISERPPGVADRAERGHWRGPVGRPGGALVRATLVARQTRYVLLSRLSADGTTEHVIEALAERICELSRHLVISLTWDQGRELAAHAGFSGQAGVDVYFCDPHSPWERGSNDNTNGLLRQYMPKGSDLSLLSQQHLDRISADSTVAAQDPGVGEPG